MKILIVSAAFYPENSPRSFRASELAKEFARQGHAVTIVTPANQPAHDEFERLHNVSIVDMGKPTWPEVKLKGSGVRLLLLRLMRRFLNLFFQYPDIQLVRMVKKALSPGGVEYDLLISIAAPHPVHWGVAMVRSRKNPIAKVWVADCGDPFMGQENDSFKVPFYFGFVEKWFCRKVDFISVPTVGAISAYYTEFLEKIKVIPQGFNFDDIDLYDGSVKKGRPTFGYAGLLIPGRRDPSQFLQYLVSLDLDFEFHIYTGTPALVIPFVEKSRGRIVLHGPVPRRELLYELSKMDFVVNIENVGSRQTPSKLIDYAIIRKPILSIKYQDSNISVVDEFLAGDYRHQLVIDNPDQYRIETVSQKFLALAGDPKDTLKTVQAE